jgi:hypothetical protein
MTIWLIVQLLLSKLLEFRAHILVLTAQTATNLCDVAFEY